MKRSAKEDEENQRFSNLPPKKKSAEEGIPRMK